MTAFSHYSSSALPLLTDTLASVPAAGVSGSITVVKMNPDVEGGVEHDVSLTEVVLPRLDGTPGFPGSVTIESARAVAEWP